MSENTSVTSASIDLWLRALDATQTDDIEFLDARDLAPTKPLSETLERLPILDDCVVFVQLNDREPRFLDPKLDNRDSRNDTVAVEEGVVTAIWRCVRRLGPRYRRFRPSYRLIDSNYLTASKIGRETRFRPVVRPRSRRLWVRPPLGTSRREVWDRVR